MELENYIGKPTGAGIIHVERGSVSRFALGVTDTNPVYHDLSAARAAGFEAPPVPPTWTFSSVFLGARPEEQPVDVTGGEGSPVMKIMQLLLRNGGLILHGEQEFRYHQSVQCGAVLYWQGRITDIYTRESKGKVMTFIVMENVFKDVAGEPVVTEIFNLIHRGN